MQMSDLEIYRTQGFGHTLRRGCAPALLVIDFVNAFVDPAHFGGGNIAQAVQATTALLDHARTAGWPVAFTRIVYADDGSDAGVFAAKVPGLLNLREHDVLSQVVDQLQPRSGELIVRKQQASAFFETPLSSWLRARGVDTLVIAGCTTSGCVRATVVDGVSHNFIPLVAVDCVGDRALGPHEATLFDLRQKYADLHSARDIASMFPSVSAPPCMQATE